MSRATGDAYTDHYWHPGRSSSPPRGSTILDRTDSITQYTVIYYPKEIRDKWCQLQALKHERKLLHALRALMAKSPNERLPTVVRSREVKDDGRNDKGEIAAPAPEDQMPLLGGCCRKGAFARPLSRRLRDVKKSVCACVKQSKAVALSKISRARKFHHL